MKATCQQLNWRNSAPRKGLSLQRVQLPPGHVGANVGAALSSPSPSTIAAACAGRNVAGVIAIRAYLRCEDAPVAARFSNLRSMRAPLGKAGTPHLPVDFPRVRYQKQVVLE